MAMYAGVGGLAFIGDTAYRPSGLVRFIGFSVGVFVDVLGFGLFDGFGWWRLQSGRVIWIGGGDDRGFSGFWCCVGNGYYDKQEFGCFRIMDPMLKSYGLGFKCSLLLGAWIYVVGASSFVIRSIGVIWFGGDGYCWCGGDMEYASLHEGDTVAAVLMVMQAFAPRLHRFHCISFTGSGFSRLWLGCFMCFCSILSKMNLFLFIICILFILLFVRVYIGLG
ncbi:hypothetical protein RchiOBHm_Chr4g0426601 [Rosa chinensis]|uniref:Transmembrane protein n=1 Tax=Rosa chinensis TaxID=74649 RepID=A0A2P6QZE4_ROSCH|nr:hypothetical protein RchiOBHm_Chr4g0426601 [Rosa chinensis]